MDGFRILFLAALLSALPAIAQAGAPGDPAWSFVPTGPLSCRPDRCPAQPGSFRLETTAGSRRALALSRWWTESPRSVLALAATSDPKTEPFATRRHAERAAMLHPDTDATFWIDAVEAELSGAKPDRAWLARVRSSGVLKSNLAGSAGANLGIELALTGTLSAETVRKALGGPDRESACAVVERFARDNDTFPNALASLHHGYCSSVDVVSLADARGVEPDPAMRVLRAERLYGMVRFRAAKQELDAVPNELAADLYCRAEFRRGRTVYRLRRRDDAMEHFKRVVERCSDDPDVRVRSLYALGDRAFDTGRLEDSKAAFEQLLADYSDRSHADDAIMYLARIARQSGESERELELVNRAISSYRDGDMLFEIVWEHLEPIFRAGKHADYLSRLGSLDLPERDDQYFSQGRLEYFAASSHLALGSRDEANTAWRSLVEKYPFSFYGYLALARLRDAGQRVSITAEAAPPAWIAADWYRDPAVRLMSAGLHDEAADLATIAGGSSEPELWRKAALLHLAGRPWASHNVVRRAIGGRPWTQPEEGRLTRWHLAWPQPFGDAIEAASEAEAAQNPNQEVRPALAAAIMREESSFIEDVESYAGALGLMQLMPRTALGHDDDIDGIATPDKLKTARVNVRVGVDHLHWLARRFDGHPVLMVAAYNAGAGATGKWLRRQPNEDIALFVEDIPYLQTRNYTKRVIGSYLAYQWLRGVEADARVHGAAKP